MPRAPAIYLGKKGAAKLGIRQLHGRGWSTFGRSNFLLPNTDVTGMFLVFCSKLQFDDNFLIYSIFPRVSG